MIGLITGILSFLVLLFKEFFSAQATARAQDKKYEVDEAAFTQLASQALTKMRWQARHDSEQAKPVEDAVDAELKRRKESENKPTHPDPRLP